MVNSFILLNTVTGETLDMLDTSKEYNLTEFTWGSIGSSRKTYKFIGQIGVHLTNTNLETRDFSLIGHVVAHSEEEMARRKRYLNAFLTPQEPMEIQYLQKYKLTGYPMSTVKYGNDYVENNDVICKYMISFYCPDPLWYELSDTDEIIAQWEPKFHFPLIIPQDKGIIMGLRTPSRIKFIPNDGDVPVGLVITFSATGSVVNPSVTKIETQEIIVFNYTLQAGESLVVSTLTNDKTVRKQTSTTDVNAFNLLDFVNTTFFNLDIGGDHIQYDAVSGIDNLSVSIKKNVARLEVQE